MSTSASALLALASRHVGERYVLGAFAPKDNARWSGPWDCAEFASWCLFQASGVLFGCDQDRRPATADAYTGYWQRDATQARCTTSLSLARSTPAAFLLRFPAPGQIGHIALSDGQGGTVEAHSTATGVIRGQVDGRRWDVGVLPPGVAYDEPPVIGIARPAGLVLRLKRPPMRGSLVTRLQEALAHEGFSPGVVDGAFGPHTAAAVKAYQLEHAMLADGEAGPLTLQALGLR
jgi:N-acetylmuramoyl-L-alanine amidase